MPRQAISAELYALLVNDEDARVCRDIPDSACDDQPVSFVRQLSAQALTQLGDALTSPKVVLPWLLTGAGAPAAIAWLVPIRESLSLLPQLIVAAFIRARPVRKYLKKSCRTTRRACSRPQQ